MGAPISSRMAWARSSKRVSVTALIRSSSAAAGLTSPQLPKRDWPLPRPIHVGGITQSHRGNGRFGSGLMTGMASVESGSTHKTIKICVSCPWCGPGCHADQLLPVCDSVIVCLRHRNPHDSRGHRRPLHTLSGRRLQQDQTLGRCG